jgi:ABC-type branched-subunit amino acid transport system permease subunit
MLICDVASVGATVHAWHVALHLGLAGVVSLGGSVFLGLGFIAHRRARRSRAALEELV